jgi:hypothetical protein
MKKQFKLGILVTLFSLILSSSYAQIPLQWARTLQLEGYWEGPAILNLGGQIFNVANYHVDFRTSIDGNALTMDEGFSDPTLGELKGTNLIGFNPFEDNIHWFSVDNFGTSHEHTGSWLTSKHFYMEHRSIQGGLPFIEYINVRLKANNQKTDLSLIATLGPDTVQIITATFVRQHNINRMGNVDVKINDILIYPNPSDNKITIESQAIINEVRITNETGQLVYTATPLDTKFSVQLNAAGIYFVQLTSDNKSEIKKVVLTSE